MSKAILPPKRDHPDEHDIFAFLHDLLGVTFNLAKKCPSETFERDIQNNVITPWARLTMFYSQKLQEKKEKEREKKSE